jgi:ABC-type amino acid transport substrate-binding protein
MVSLKGLTRRTWFLPILTVLVVGSLLAAAIVVSNTVQHTSHVVPPALTLGEISSLNGTAYPGGDLPDLVSNDPVMGHTYDFACLLMTDSDFDSVVLNFTINKTGGDAVSVDDVQFQICDYNGSNNTSNWEWMNVALTLEGGNLVGKCYPSWGSSIKADGSCNLNNAFHISYQSIGDFSIFITASNDILEPMNLLETIQARGKIVVGTQVPYPPWENINVTTDEIEGIDMDIMAYIAGKLNVTIEYKPMDFDPLFAAVQTGQIDCAISAITITTERDEVNDFTMPYCIANQAALVQETSSIANINDLNGTDIVSQIGTTGSYWVDDNLSPGSHVTLADVPAAAIGVENGVYDAFITDAVVANGFANDTNYHLKVAFVIYTLESYGILIPENEPELKAAMDAAITEMIADGTLDEIMLKWLI